ncbi:hypothetical protein [Microvirga massiliensis]|uniref:hypothetical protein n=1 Tax=Microvirga massiliensis TaxID=1033741 RepID=UPI00062B9962|nr:hypothetical protein [Microvirga massiliensis]
MTKFKVFYGPEGRHIGALVFDAGSENSALRMGRSWLHDTHPFDTTWKVLWATEIGPDTPEGACAQQARSP